MISHAKPATPTLCSLAVALFFAASGPVKAEQPSTGLPEQPEWSFSLGGGALYGPDYTGSDDFEAQGLPWVDVAYGDRFFIRFPEGIGINLIQDSQLTVGFSLGYGGGRDNEGDLSPIKKVDDGALGSGFINYSIGRVELSATATTAISGDNEGHAVKVGLTLKGSLTRQWLYSVGPGVRWHSKDWNEALFSLSPAEASKLGTTPFSAGSGISEFGIQGILIYLWSPRISTTAFAGVSRLINDAADSPIVETLGRATQPSIAVVAAYRF